MEGTRAGGSAPMMAGDRVELSLPARADMLFLVRLQVAAAAARLDLGVDAIDDLRLAVDELCLTLLSRPVQPDGRLDVVLLWDDASVEVVCGVAVPPGEGVPATANGGSGWEDPATASAALSGHVLDALVDEHGAFSADGRAVSWLRKRCSMPSLPAYMRPI